MAKGPSQSIVLCDGPSRTGPIQLRKRDLRQQVGDRLALGTNLFSDLPTLAERVGLDVLNEEISKHSDFYNDTLIPEKKEKQNGT